MRTVVKFFITEDGEKDTQNVWHAVNPYGPCSSALCSGQVYGFGEGRIALYGKHYKTKEAKNGAVTCSDCREQLKFFKTFPL